MASRQASTASTSSFDVSMFQTYFDEEVKSLKSTFHDVLNPAQSDTRNDTIKDCLARISHLSSEVSGHSSQLPAHDLRKYTHIIDALASSLRDARELSTPTKKFSFKRKPKTATSDGAVDDRAPKDEAVPSVSAAMPSSSGIGAGAARVSQSASDKGRLRPLEMADLEGVHYVLSSDRGQAPGFGTLSNLRSCFIDMSTTEAGGSLCATLSSTGVEDSLVIGGVIRGPIHLTKHTRCIIVVSCQQFRLHESRNCDVYLNCASRPIIESCKNIRFAPLPTYLSERWQITPTSRWNHVDDFKWLKQEPSPHWHVLPEDARLADEIWEKLMPADGKESVVELLRVAGLEK